MLAGALAPSVHANELGAFYEMGPRPDATRLSAGFAVLASPRYDGSDKRRWLAVPSVSAQIANGVFADPVNGVGINYGTGRDLQWGLRATVETGRPDQQIAGLDGVSAGINPGLFANLRVGERLALKAALRAAMAGGSGSALHLGGTWDLWREGPAAVGLGVSLRWADARYNQAYYGVTASQAARTGLRTHAPGAGVNAVQAGVSGRMALSPRWIGFAGLSWQQLVGDVADSPLVQERGSPRLAVGAAYRF